MVNIIFLALITCKSWFIVLFIVANGVLKKFKIDFYFDGFSLVTSGFTLEKFETVDIFFGYSFASFYHEEVMFDSFFLSS